MQPAEYLSYLARKFTAESGGLKPTHAFVPDSFMDNIPTREGYEVKVAGMLVLASTDLDEIVVSAGLTFPSKP